MKKQAKLATPCPNCNGDGHVTLSAKSYEWDEPCRLCKGECKIHFDCTSKKEAKAIIEWLHGTISYGSKQ